MRFKKLKRRCLLLALTTLFSIFLTAGVQAQSGTSTINGTVNDPQGNVIAGATVNLTSSDRGFTRTATTTESGTFSFPSIQPGVYQLEIQANGFKKYVQNELKVIVDTPTNVAAVLEVGSVTEVVNVESNTSEALLNTQDATVGNTFVAQQVTQLPTEARNVINLLTLQPGVTKDGYVAGNRSDQSNVTLDGVDINEAQTNDINSPVLRLNSEAIEEFRLTTTTANAAQGRSSGAQVSLVTKSGTNEFRGALFYTARRTAWSANNFFNNRAGVEREKFDRNVYGGALGGPIMKDRLFFFYSYEGERTVRGASAIRVVPLPSLGQGIVRFQASTGQVVSLSCAEVATIFPATQGCNPAALAILSQAASRYQANTTEGGGDGLNTGGFRFNADRNIKNNSHVARFDWNITSEQQAFFRANVIDDVEDGIPAFPDTPKPRLWEHPWGFVAGHTWTISNNLVNNFRYGFTRDAFSSQGDSASNAISFRFVYTPFNYSRTISRVTPVQNFTNDLSYIWRTHTFQFGTNIRLIRNKRSTFANAFDSATTNPSFYPGGGSSITTPINSYLQTNRQYQIAGSAVSNVQNAVTAVIGRYSQYAANFTFLKDGTLQEPGTPSNREFRTEEYDFYVQDIWKLFPNLTITAGLRYGLSRPVYEAEGYEVKPNVPLGEYFRRRAAGAASGTPYNDPIVLDLSGPANGKSPLYKWDRNNFQPRVAVAWSPDFGDNWFGRFFGREGKSVIRGGFGIFNDYFGQSLAVRFDLNNTLGFSSSSQTRANFHNLTTNPGPRFTGLDQVIRNPQVFTAVTLPSGLLTFPRQAPTRTFPTAIEGGLDEDLVSPIHYTWSLTYERTLPAGFIVSASYLGRKARNLLQSRDAAAIANYVDPVSGTDWYTAATQLEVLRARGVPVSQIQQIPYFANVFPSNLASLLGFPSSYNQTQAVYALAFDFYGNDWTSAQLDLSTLSARFPGQHIFYQPQYGTYGAWSTIGRSDYHGATFTVRQRLGQRLTMDFNYTFSKSMDEGSGLQADAVTSGSGFILNPFRQGDMYALSDFDMKHIINANAIWQVPIGRGQPYFSNLNKWADAVIGGWQITGIFRYNSGTPFPAPYDDARWATNWNVQSYTTRTNSNVKPCPTRGGKLFGCNTLEAYRSFRNAYPGETGDRNVFRTPGYWVIDMGFGKSFKMPYNENHKMQFRWEIFNLTNTQHMGDIDTSRSGYGLGLVPPPNDPAAVNQFRPPTNWSDFTGIQGDPRIMQIVLRYSF
jgi:hypothetical protein